MGNSLPDFRNGRFGGQGQNTAQPTVQPAVPSGGSTGVIDQANKALDSAGQAISSAGAAMGNVDFSKLVQRPQETLTSAVQDFNMDKRVKDAEGPNGLDNFSEITTRSLAKFIDTEARVRVCDSKVDGAVIGPFAFNTFHSGFFFSGPIGSEGANWSVYRERQKLVMANMDHLIGNCMRRGNTESACLTHYPALMWRMHQLSAKMREE